MTPDIFQPTRTDKALFNNAISISATSSAIVSVLLGYPFDSLKTRMQSFHYSSTFACIRSTYSAEGLRGFFRGVFPVLVSVSTLRTVAFTLYTKGKLQIRSVLDGKGLSQVEMIGYSAGAAGVLTGAVVATLNVPFEFVKLQRQLEVLNSSTHSSAISNRSHASNTSLYRWITRTYTERGPSIFFKAAHLHIIRDSLGTGIYFAGYELMKLQLAQVESIPGRAVHVVAGGVVGAVCCVVLFPIDVIKSVIQRDALKPMQKYTNATAFITSALKKQGVKRFYAGIAPQLFRSFPVHALNFYVYERVLEFCGADPI